MEKILTRKTNIILNKDDEIKEDVIPINETSIISNENKEDVIPINETSIISNEIKEELPPTYETSIILKPIPQASAPPLDEEELIYINDFLNNDNICSLPYINIMNDDIYKKSIELLKTNHNYIEYIKNPSYEQWMIVYRKVYIDNCNKNNFEYIFKKHKSHDLRFCKILITKEPTFFRYFHNNVKTKEICDIVINEMIKNQNNQYDAINYRDLTFIPEEFITEELCETIANPKYYQEKTDASYFLNYIPLKFKTEQHLKKYIKINNYVFDNLCCTDKLEICKYAIDFKPSLFLEIFSFHQNYYELFKYTLKYDNRLIIKIKTVEPDIELYKFTFDVIECHNEKLVNDIKNHIIYKINNSYYHRKEYLNLYSDILNYAVNNNGFFLKYITLEDIKIIGNDNYNKIKKDAIKQTPNANAYVIDTCVIL